MDSIQKNIEKVIKNIKSGKEISIEHSLKDDLGFDSLDLITLYFDLEKTFNIKIEGEDLQGEKLTTIRRIVEYIHEKTGQTA